MEVWTDIGINLRHYIGFPAKCGNPFEKFLPFYAKQINANLQKKWKIFAIFHEIVEDFFKQNYA